MFVSGEPDDASIETTTLIEKIVQDQVKEMLTRATELAKRGGQRSIGVEHMVFLIRHDTEKVSRLKMFLSWKDVRRNARDSDDKGGEADVPEDPGAAAGGGGGVGPDLVKKNKRAKIILPWDIPSFYAEQVPEREDEEDYEELENDEAHQRALVLADLKTAGMTKEEYCHYSECRQASFTFRKGKRFKDWAGFGEVTEGKPNDDIIDILGFLTSEMVQTLTEDALKIKSVEDGVKRDSGLASTERKRKRIPGPFDPPEEGRMPVEAHHIQEAFRRLQMKNPRIRYMMNDTRRHHRIPLQFI